MSVFMFVCMHQDYISLKSVNSDTDILLIAEALKGHANYLSLAQSCEYITQHVHHWNKHEALDTNKKMNECRTFAEFTGRPK